MTSKNLQTATLAGGCFWCLEAVYRRVRGVHKVTSGYTGGDVDRPLYEQVTSGQTGHVEAVQLEFDPQEITYSDLLDIFWEIHDPTSFDRQGNDVGSQYRAVIFYHDEEQRQAAEESKKKLQESGKLQDRIVTQIQPASAFFAAEKYHQEYYEKNRQQGYCRLVIDPKLQKFFDKFPEKVM